MDVSRQISLGEYLPANRANGNWLPSDFAGPRVHLDETVGLGRPRFTNDSNKPDGAPGGHALPRKAGSEVVGLDVLSSHL